MRNNIDTDQIMPKQFLTRTERTGYGDFIFHDWRYDEHGNPDPSFVLNDPVYTDASVLVTGYNFGCGSSREHAPWGLYQYGFRVIIAESFADIFYNNCFKTGLLPIRAGAEAVGRLTRNSGVRNEYVVDIDLEDQCVSDKGGLLFRFELEPFRKMCLLEGLDDIGITERYTKDISRYEENTGITGPAGGP